ncbi:MAG: haloacid dehalogenase-like hydrolase [Oscillospiraceae bacterium]|nr:haloacid dehalogenase-like hydrolase [Oscillospiraceae bacterium]
MRVYDFDNTIYNGESILDFYLFSIRYNPREIKYLFVVAFNTAKYKMGRSTRSELEQKLRKYVKGYMSSFRNREEIVRAFWDTHIKKLKVWFRPHPDDLIITASFNILMDELLSRINFKNCICSVIDCDSMDIKYLNFNDNKLKTFLERFGPDVIVDEFYTDSIFDMPMIGISKKAFLVKGNKIEQIK